jgi:2-dehydropantoate 2-reductase
MKSVIVGAGAIGAYIGAAMSRAGQDVTLFARGAHLLAMQERGVHVQTEHDEWHAYPKVTGDLESVGPVDVVFLAVKAHSLPGLMPKVRSLLGPDTAVVGMQNGVPWWFFQMPEVPYSGMKIARVDPDGIIAETIDPHRVVGSIVYVAATIVEPGVIQHSESNRISMGEPDGSRSERCRRIAAALVAAGLKAPVTTHLRDEIWVKLLGNVSINPISALTRATVASICSNNDTRQLLRSIMEEASDLGKKLGLDLPISIDQRIAGAMKVGEHKTSMLQDLEAGRPLELDALVGAPLDIGEKLGVPMPHTRTVYACTKLLTQEALKL